MDRKTSALSYNDIHAMRLHDLRTVEHEAIESREYIQLTTYQELWNNSERQEGSLVLDRNYMMRERIHRLTLFEYGDQLCNHFELYQRTVKDRNRITVNACLIQLDSFQV